MLKKVILTAGLLVTAAAVCAAPAAVGLINKVSKGKLEVQSTFSTPFELTGYVVTPKDDKNQRMVMYADKSGKYLFIGNVVNEKGQNLTQMYSQKYIIGPKAIQAFKEINSTHWFTDGKNSAPHKAYVLMDPNCIYCHLLYKQLRPYIESGKVQIRWIPVAFMRADSMGKSAALLHADSDATSVKLLAQDEAHFNMKTEEGSLKPLASSSNDMSVTTAYSKVAQNNAFFKKYLQGTPAIFFKDQSGKVQLIPSYIEKAQLADAISRMSNKW